MATYNKRKIYLTVAPELHEAWKKLTRPGDPKLLANVLVKSLPIITNALKYGYALNDLPVKISSFFMKRLNSERATAKELIETSFMVVISNILDEAKKGLTVEAFADLSKSIITETISRNEKK